MIDLHRKQNASTNSNYRVAQNLKAPQGDGVLGKGRVPVDVELS